MFFCRRFLALLVFSTLTLASAESMRADERRRPLPALRSVTESGATAIELTDLDIRVRLEGHLARTEYVLTYQDRLDRTLRADFLFPLPPGSRVSEVGLYFDGHLRRAVAVGRTEERIASQDVASRRVDPILAEWATGNTFRYDVYPVPARGEKKILLAYDQELPFREDSLQYQLDLRHGAVLRSFRIQVTSSSEFTHTFSGPHPITLKRSDGAFVYAGQTQALDTLLVASIPRPARPTALIELGTDGRSYMSLPINVDRIERVPYPPTGHVMLLWDASASASTQHPDTLLGFLRAFVARQGRLVDVDVVPFHLWVEEPIVCPNVDTVSGWRNLEKVLSELVPVGATNFAALFGTLKSMGSRLPEGSRVVLVTDGMSSLGTQDDAASALRQFAGQKKPVIVLNSAESCDSDMLSSIATVTRGWYVDARNPSDAETKLRVNQVMRSPLILKRAVWKDASDSGTTRSVALDGETTLTVTARLERPVSGGEVTLALEDSDGIRNRSVRFETRRVGGNQDVVRAAWANDHLIDLLVSGDRAAVRDHGLAHRLVTPETSLVVLERWEDYMAHDVEMPPAVREAYKQFMHDRDMAWRTHQPRPIDGKGASDGFGCCTLTGVVVDEAEVVLPGVTVSVISQRGTTSTTTDKHGHFVIRAVAPGAFTLTASLTGFARLVRSFPEGSNHGGNLRLALRTGGLEETITVQTMAPPEKTVLPKSTLAADAGGVVVPPPRRVMAGDAHYPHWLPKLGIQDRHLPIASARANRELAHGITKALADATRGDREILEMYAVSRSALGAAKWFAIDASGAVAGERPALAARVISDLVETDAEDAGLARIVAQILEAWGRSDLAEPLFKRAIALAPLESQGYLCMARWSYVGPLDGLWRWTEKRSIPLPSQAQRAEVLRTLNQLRPSGLSAPLFANVALQVELNWDKRAADLDLEVTEPSGETAHHGTGACCASGHLSADAQSYGPEAYVLTRSVPGEYRVRVSYARADAMEIDRTTVATVVASRFDDSGNLERRVFALVLDEPGELWEGVVRLR